MAGRPLGYVSDSEGNPGDSSPGGLGTERKSSGASVKIVVQRALKQASVPASSPEISGV